ncbi:MAG: helix-hairpin-helix domain-containing protein [Gemmataceae bacterium]
MDTPAPPPAPPPPADRRPERALAVVVVLLAAVLAARAYSGRAGLRPTEQHLAVASQLDLNRADRAELLQVPGVGPALADAILTHRQGGRRFGAVDDLRGVRGVGPATLEKLRPWLTVGEQPDESSADPPPALEKLERKPPAPKPSAPVRGGKVQSGDPPIDVNAADEAELMRLPGVGPTLAGRIVLARGTERFKSVDDLRRVKGIGVKTLDNLRPFVVCR